MYDHLLPYLRFLFCLSIILTANTYSYSQSTSDMNAITKGEKLIEKAVRVHGGEKYAQAHFQFVFRDKTYSFHNSADGYKYTLNYNQGENQIYDVLDNNSFSRTVNGELTTLSAKKHSGYKESLNSVIYFALLPYKLLDKAVNAVYFGDQVIKGKDYSMVQVTFDQEGGGKDYEDKFMYWFNSSTGTMDYLAYSYHVNGGGVRFRTAYNSRKVGGIIFQDYINYKADPSISLDQLPALWEEGKLKELSRIETESVKEL